MGDKTRKRAERILTLLFIRSNSRDITKDLNVTGESGSACMLVDKAFKGKKIHEGAF